MKMQVSTICIIYNQEFAELILMFSRSLSIDSRAGYCNSNYSPNSIPNVLVFAYTCKISFIPLTSALQALYRLQICVYDKQAPTITLSKSGFLKILISYVKKLSYNSVFSFLQHFSLTLCSYWS